MRQCFDLPVVCYQRLTQLLTDNPAGTRHQRNLLILRRFHDHCPVKREAAFSPAFISD
jgi:hypothetical protein